MTALGEARLLRGLTPGAGGLTLAEHVALHGPLPALAGEELMGRVGRSGLRGRGGAGFSTAVKLRAAARRRRVAAVVVNGAETEPLSGKDRLLLARLPHLVLDGAVLAARAVGAEEVVVAVGPGGGGPGGGGARAPGDGAGVPGALVRAAAERDELPIRIAEVPAAFVAGQETAVIAALDGRPAKPTVVPPRPYERGLRRRPTLVQNTETLAHLALIARHGEDWYRALGTEEDPGTLLLTVAGAVAEPGVIEVAHGTTVGDALLDAGGPTGPLRAVLVGGYFGAWVAAPEVLHLRLARADLRAVGATLGAGVLLALGVEEDGLRMSAEITEWLAGQSSGQCGPCHRGLPAIAELVARVADGTAGMGDRARLLRWCVEIQGRGACHHPDGAAGFVESALTTFDAGLAELGG